MMATSDLPYQRGDLVASTEDDYRKLRHAWHLMAEREYDRIFNFSGLERSLVTTVESHLLDDELGPALFAGRMTSLILDHLGGSSDVHDAFVANRLSAAIFLAMQVTVTPGTTVVALAPGYSHPSVVRGVRYAGATLVDTTSIHQFRDAVELHRPEVVVLTRMSVDYEFLDLADVEHAVAVAREHDALVFIDDAGGARVVPAIFGQPRTLQMGADLGATGLDKYGTTGPRLGLIAGRHDLLVEIRSRAFEFGMEARPMLYPAVVHSLEQYRPERVRELVLCTQTIARELREILGGWLIETPVAVRLPGEGILLEASRRAGAKDPLIVPYEATAALAMLLLRDYGMVTVHFAGVPPGTSALLIKFVRPETLARFGGASSFAKAIDSSLDTLATIIESPAQVGRLLFGTNP